MLLRMRRTEPPSVPRQPPQGSCKPASSGCPWRLAQGSLHRDPDKEHIPDPIKGDARIRASRVSTDRFLLLLSDSRKQREGTIFKVTSTQQRQLGCWPNIPGNRRNKNLPLLSVRVSQPSGVKEVTIASTACQFPGVLVVIPTPFLNGVGIIIHVNEV